MQISIFSRLIRIKTLWVQGVPVCVCMHVLQSQVPTQWQVTIEHVRSIQV